MKLAKKTRKRFHEAEGEPVEFSWPASAPEPFRGHKYPVYTGAGRAFSIRLENVKRRPSGTKVIAVVDNDSHRPMIGLQGVRTDAGDYESEPERVPASFENEMAVAGRRRFAEHRVSESERTRKGRGMQRKLSEAMKQLRPEEQVELLAKLERDIKEAKKEVSSGPKAKGQREGQQCAQDGPQGGQGSAPTG